MGVHHTPPRRGYARSFVHYLCHRYNLERGLAQVRFAEKWAWFMDRQKMQREMLRMPELFNRNDKVASTVKPNWLLDYAINSPAYSVSMYNCQRFTQYTYKCAHVVAGTYVTCP